MRKRTLSVLAAAAVVITAPQALAFGTIRGLGQNAEHETITRNGLAVFGFGPNTMNQLAGTNGTFGAVGAPDNPARGLMGTHAAHCDGGDYFNTPGYGQTQPAAQAQLTACRTYMAARLQDAVNDAAGVVRADMSLGNVSLVGGCTFNGVKGRDKCNVLEDLGLLLHASQDFYSHSNWVDTVAAPGTVNNPPGLNNNAPAPWLSLRGAAGPFPAGLITGCYDGFPETLYCNGRVKHAYLNKDTTGTARGLPAYNLAMTVAARDTAAKWDDFKQALAAAYGGARASKIICAVKSDTPTAC